MPQTKGQNFQNVNDAALPILGFPARSENDDIIAGINTNADKPLRLYAASTPDAKLYFSASKILASNGSGKAPSPIDGLMPDFVSSWIDFQNGTTNGGTFTISFPTTAVGQFRRFGFTMLSDSSIKAIYSAASASVGALDDAGTLFDDAGFPLGWIDLESTNLSGKFKTAGSSTDIIENSVGGVARIYNITDSSLAKSTASSFDVNDILVGVGGAVLTNSDGNVLLKG